MRNEFLNGLKHEANNRNPAIMKIIEEIKNLTDEEIEQKLRNMSYETRELIQQEVLLRGKIQLLSKIQYIIDKIKKEQINSLTNAINEGKIEEALSKMSYDEKCDLIVKIEQFRGSYERLLREIESSIDEELESDLDKFF